MSKYQIVNFLGKGRMEYFSGYKLDSYNSVDPNTFRFSSDFQDAYVFEDVGRASNFLFLMGKIIGKNFPNSTHDIRIEGI